VMVVGADKMPNLNNGLSLAGPVDEPDLLLFGFGSSQATHLSFVISLSTQQVGHDQVLEGFFWLNCSNNDVPTSDDVSLLFVTPAPLTSLKLKGFNEVLPNRFAVFWVFELAGLV